MNAAISVKERGTYKRRSDNVDNLLVQLDHYRRQSEWLTRVNELQFRLACATDLPGMIEAFSVWLTHLVPHDFISYRSLERKRQHAFCSCHGPERREVEQIAEDIYRNADYLTDEVSRRHGDFFVHVWKIFTDEECGYLMLLRRGERIEAPESEILVQALKILAEPLQRALDYEDLFEQARRDTLTGLHNRRVFEGRIYSLLEGAKRHKHPVTLLSMDLDHFKQVNDTLGHAVGDEVLRKVAKTMAQMVRGSDLLVRMGGDEFVMVLTNTDKDAARKLADRLCRAVENLQISTADGIRLGISIGLVQWREEMSKENWLQQADEVLYRAKADGRCRVCMDKS